MHFISVTTLAAAILGFAAAPAMAQSVADFYKGKRIEMIVGSGPGGGYDVYARLLIRHMGRFIPGNPTFIAKNMDGAGSIIATNFMVNVAAKDGTVIGAMQRNAVMVEIMGQSGPQFKAKDLNWLGSLSDEAGACGVAKRTGIKSFQEILDKQFIFGATGPNDTEINPAVINNLLSGKIRLVKGYPQTPAVHLAIQRGEVDGVCQSWASLKEHSGQAMKSGDFIPVVQLTIKPVEELSKMGVPVIFEFVKQSNLPAGMTIEEANNYLELVMGVRVMGRPYMVAPGVPADRVQALRTAFAATAKDPQFLEDAVKSRRDIDLVTGEEVQAIVGKMAVTPKDRLDRLDSLTQFRGASEAAKVEMPKHTGKVTKSDEGRTIAIDAGGKEVSTGLSASRTKVTLSGAEAKREQIKVGMTCTITLASEGDKEAASVDCKS